MRCPKLSLSPLQARFAASLAATLFLVALYFFLSNPRLVAYAIDVDSLIPEDHNHPVSLELDIRLEDDAFQPALLSEADSDFLKETNILRRAPSGVESLHNNEPHLKNLKLGETQHWMFPKEDVTGSKSPATPGLPPVVEAAGVSPEESIMEDLKQRDSILPPRAAKVYVTINTCLQPSLNATRESKDTGPPQLQLYVSQSESNQQPGPGVDDPDMQMTDLDDGYASIVLDNADGDIYIGVSAPNNTRYSGVYNYEVAASIDAPYHSVDTNMPFLFFVDGDSGAALLQTNDTTQAEEGTENFKQWMALDPPPYTIFGHNMNDTAIMGLQKSFCGLSKMAQIRKGTSNVDTRMTDRGIGHKPKEQFYVKGLNNSSTYYGFLAMEGNSTASGTGVVGGGGKVWKFMNFTTKAENNCAILYDLEFCSEVAYAVPSNPNMKRAELKEFYDSNAKNLYQNFSRSLQQIACHASPSSQYSLARTCADCDAAYKQWLCAVTVPRCQDFSSGLPFLRERNVVQPFVNGSVMQLSDKSVALSVLSNSSRNALIDTEIKPGPYKEVLPCEDLCYDLVRSCPAALGFSCPQERWLNMSYGTRDPDGDITCSYLGAAYFLSSAWRIEDGVRVLLGSTLGFWVFLWAVLLL